MLARYGLPVNAGPFSYLFTNLAAETRQVTVSLQFNGIAVAYLTRGNVCVSVLQTQWDALGILVDVPVEAFTGEYTMHIDAY